MSTLPEWAHAHGPVTARARMRVQPEDFRVEEVLGFGADGDGPHVLLTVEKRGANTHWVAGQLARLAGIAPREVGYAGLKDRRAVTVQHFTLNLDRKPEPDWSSAGGEEFRVLAAARHRRKLKTGVLKGNRFRLVLRELGEPAATLVPKLEAVAQRGVPNYFGSQRFGRGGGNVAKAEAMLVGGRRVHDRRLRSLLLSTARSLLFNAVLSQRVASGTWDTLLDGDVLMLDGSRSVFRSEPGDAALPPFRHLRRLQHAASHRSPVGPGRAHERRCRPCHGGRRHGGISGSGARSGASGTGGGAAQPAAAG